MAQKPPKEENAKKRLLCQKITNFLEQHDQGAVAKHILVPADLASKLSQYIDQQAELGHTVTEGQVFIEALKHYLGKHGRHKKGKTLQKT